MSWIFHAAPAGLGAIDRIVTSIQCFLQNMGATDHSHVVTLWLFFAGCGVTQLSFSFLICTPIERLRPLTSWPSRNPIAADVAYAFFVRLILFPLVTFFEYSWLQMKLEGFLLAHAFVVPSLTTLIPALASWPLLLFFINFAILDLSDYWRHRLSHRYGWWYGVHSVHHAEDQMTFWSDERSHILEDTITYIWLILVGLIIGVPSFQFPFVILGFRFIGSIAHANTSISYGWLGEHVFISPKFHRTHHALKAAGRRSCNFGTSLSWWDILFGTAKFKDNTVETGDAGAEPAMVTGSWAAQQEAGFRRMVRLAKRGRKSHTAKVVL